MKSLPRNVIIFRLKKADHIKYPNRPKPNDDLTKVVESIGYMKPLDDAS